MFACVGSGGFYLLMNDITSLVCRQIAGSQGSESQDYDLQGCDYEQPGTRRNFRRKLLLPFSDIVKIMKARLIKFRHSYQTTWHNTQKMVVLTHYSINFQTDMLTTLKTFKLKALLSLENMCNDVPVAADASTNNEWTPWMISGKLALINFSNLKVQIKGSIFAKHIRRFQLLEASPRTSFVTPYLHRHVTVATQNNLSK
jgi:hypothetical protein